MSDIYYDTYNEGEAPREEKSRAARIAGIIWRTAVVAVVLTVFFVIIYRVVEMQEPSGTGEFLFTAKSLQVYDELGTQSTVEKEYSADAYAVRKETLTTVTLVKRENSEQIQIPTAEYYEKAGFTVYEAHIGSYTVKDEDSNVTRTVAVTWYYDEKGSPVEGALSVGHIYLVPAAKQVQVTFRYRSDSLGKLEGHKAADGSAFRYQLRDDKDRTYESYAYKTDERGTYRYITMVFEDVELSDAETLALDVHYFDKSYGDAVLSIPMYDSGIPQPMTKTEIERAQPEELQTHVDEENG